MRNDQKQHKKRGIAELPELKNPDFKFPETANMDAELSEKLGLRLVEMENQLAYMKEQLRTTLEEMESTSKIVKSASEEMQYNNDKLQDTNEILLLSRLDQESLNDEILMLNIKLKAKADLLTDLNNDIINLMNGTQLAMIFLDKELCIKRFTPPVTGTFNLRSIDIGRPITDIIPNLLYKTIEQDIRNVQDTLVVFECQIQSTDSRWFIIRIIPYLTPDNLSDGVVITFSDVTELKILETNLLESESLSHTLIDIYDKISTSINFDFDDVIRTVVLKAADAIGIDLGVIAECKGDQWVVRYVCGAGKMRPGLRFTSAQAPYHELISNTIIPIAINDTSEETGIYSELYENYGIKSILGIPLISEKKLFGVLSFVSTSNPINFTNAIMDFAHKLGLAISLALTNFRLYEAEQQTQQLLQQQHSILQQALIPNNPPTAPGYKVASRFIAGAAGEQVGGDFFDVFRTEDSKLAILIGDVAGKGVESASLATITRSTIRAFAYDHVAPGEALTHTNAVMLGHVLIPGLFVTAFLAVLDEKNGNLRYSAGGHPPAMIRRVDGSIELIEMVQFPICLFEDTQYLDGETQLEIGDKLLMYTDGISESRSNNIMYDIEGIQTTFREQGGLTPEETLDALFKAATEAGGGHLSDDAAVIIIERCA